MRISTGAFILAGIAGLILFMHITASHLEVSSDLGACNPGPSCVVQVSRVIDGDTVEIMNGTRIRFANYDAAELDTTEGRVSSSCVKQKIYENNRRMTIYQIRLDIYGRTLARVFNPSLSACY